MACTSKLIGDVNGDGIVDQADAGLLFNWVSYPNERETTYKLTCPENADVTGNGSVNIGDAILLQNHIWFPDDPTYALAQPSGIVIPGGEYDPCTGVVCDDECYGVDKYSRICVDGICVQGSIVEPNSLACGYDPCTGVVCDDKCVGVDKYSQLCVDGACVQGSLIEANSLACGYVPPVAKGKMDSVSYIACHALAGCSPDFAYWDSDVTVSVGFTNIGNAPGEFKARLSDSATGALVAESAFQTVDVGATGLAKPLFVMPHVTSLSLKLELIRNE